MQEIVAYLTANGWPPPIVADSGNGGHAMYRIELPTDDGGLVQRCLKALAGRFDDAVVKVDTVVYNPARIWKLYGTRACKGDDVDGRPWRLARILQAPDTLQVVPVELLQALAAEVPTATSAAATSQQADASGERFNVADFIRRHGLEVDGPHDWRGEKGVGMFSDATQPLRQAEAAMIDVARPVVARLHDLQGALDALPDLTTAPETTATPQAMAATGTDTAAGYLPANRQQYSSETTQNEAGSGEMPPSGNDNADCPNVLPIKALSDNRRDSAKWSGPGLNWRHTDFQSVALPTELPDQKTRRQPFRTLLPPWPAHRPDLQGFTATPGDPFQQG